MHYSYYYNNVESATHLIINREDQNIAYFTIN